MFDILFLRTLCNVHPIVKDRPVILFSSCYTEQTAIKFLETIQQTFVKLSFLFRLSHVVHHCCVDVSEIPQIQCFVANHLSDYLHAFPYDGIVDLLRPRCVPSAEICRGQTVSNVSVSLIATEIKMNFSPWLPPPLVKKSIFTGRTISAISAKCIFWLETIFLRPSISSPKHQFLTYKKNRTSFDNSTEKLVLNRKIMSNSWRKP